MRTEISSLGKHATLAKLFEGSGLINQNPVRIQAKGECSSAQRVLLEGVDFDLVYTPLKHLGYKAVLSVIGELYAILRTPVSLSVNLALSKRFCYEDVQELWTGILAACKEHKINQVGLDLNPSVNGLCISLAACGVQKKGILEKVPESKNMDLICLSGHLGAAYMGLHVLEREKIAFTGTSEQPDLSQYKAVVASYLSPEIKPNTIERFIEADVMPSRGYFVTKGLADALMHLTHDTGLGAKVYLEKIPISSQTFAMADEIGMDPVTAAMNGGDDFRFIFTVPIGKHETMRREFHDYDIIGHTAQPEVGTVMVTPEGAEFEIKAQGYQSASENVSETNS